MTSPWQATDCLEIKDESRDNSISARQFLVALPVDSQDEDGALRRKESPQTVLRSADSAGSWNRRGTRMKYRVLIEQDEDGVFVAEVPSLPGCVSQGSTRQEAIENVKEAITAYLESLAAHDEAIPPPIDEELVEVAV
jgi:predicted RNase H-like HicB family nuclease